MKSARADAIVVLGCRMPPDGSAGGALLRRVEHAATLWREGAAPLLLLSGGGEGPWPEAQAMRDLAIAAGVPEPSLLVEATSRNTVENAVFSARLLRERGLGRVVVVTDAYHLLRARLLFRAAGLEVAAASAPPPNYPRDVVMYVREAVAIPRSLLRLAVRALRPR
jgi:uncharacterized SAM-binding protein YcdF (DUF218 family)